MEWISRNGRRLVVRDPTRSMVYKPMDAHRVQPATMEIFAGSPMFNNERLPADMMTIKKNQPPSYY